MLKKLKKSLALGICFIFFTEQLGAAPETSSGSISHLSVPSREQTSLVEPSRDFTIPFSLGEIRILENSGRSKASETAPRLILIEDAHGQTSAQQSIANLLNYLRETYGVQNYFIEGAYEGKISRELLEFFNREDLNQEVQKRFLQEGFLGGPELFIHHLDPSAEAYGLESPQLYASHLEQFRKVYASYEKTSKFYHRFLVELKTLMSRHSEPVLQVFLNRWWDYQNDPSRLSGYVQGLKKDAFDFLRLDLENPKNQQRYPHLARYRQIENWSKEKTAPGSEAKLHEEKEKWLSWIAQKSWDQDYQHFFSLLFSENPKASRALRNLDLRTMIEQFYAEAASQGFKFESYPTASRFVGVQVLLRN